MKKMSTWAKNRNIFFVVLVTNALFLSVSAKGSHAGVTAGASNSYLPYLQVGGTRFFNSSDTTKLAADINLFIPLWQSRLSHLVFTHLRLYDRSGKPFEGNVHLGYRYLSPEQDYLYGVYGAFDSKRSNRGTYFRQVTFGVEGWFGKVFIGGNFYRPVGKSTKLSGEEFRRVEFDYAQKNIWVTSDGLYEQAAAGGDAEIGYEFLNGLVGYGGGYYFNGRDIDPIYGPKARLTYDLLPANGKRVLGIFDKLGLEAGVQRDKIRGGVWYLSANFRIGLLFKNSNLGGVSRHMTDLVRRDVDIVIDSFTKKHRDFFGNSVEVANDDGLRSAMNSSQTKIIIAKNPVYVNTLSTSSVCSGNSICEKSVDELSDKKIIANYLNSVLQSDGKLILYRTGGDRAKCDARCEASKKAAKIQTL